MMCAFLTSVSGLIFFMAFTSDAMAETQVAVSETHLCCRACVVAVDKALAQVKGIKHQASQDDETIKITAESDETAQKAIDALAKAGFHGKLDNDKLKYKPVDVPEGKVTRLEIEGIHNCCNSCNKAIKQAVASVTGVKADTAKAKESSFVVEGDFVANDVLKALFKAGFHARVKK
jgi:copper chaperone CopZ